MTILGEPDRIKHVWVGGRAMDLSAPEPRSRISGWQLASMGRQLTRDMAFSNTRPDETLYVEELH